VAGWIGFADVSLDLHDDPGGRDATTPMHEDLTEQVAGDGERAAIVELAGQLHAGQDSAAADGR
jgi:hypothetical protein